MDDVFDGVDDRLEWSTELTRFTPALFAPRFRLSVGTLVTHGKGGILSLNQDRATDAD